MHMEEEYYVKLVELDRKYPIQGHDPPLTKNQYRNYRKIKEIHEIIQCDGSKLLWIDHIRPKNFKEAAEMYMSDVTRDMTPIDFKSLASGERKPGEEG